MSMVRDNEIRAVERMVLVLTMAKTVFPSDRNIMNSWFKVCKEIQAHIDMQEENIKRFDKDLT